MFLVPALAALQKRDLSRHVWVAVFIALMLLIGLRYDVGGDWGSYIGYVIRAGELSFAEILLEEDPSYILLSWLADKLVGSVWVVNLVAGAIFSAGLVRFVRTLPDPLVALTIAIPYMTIVLAMGYTRQAIAFGLLLWGLVYLAQARKLGFVLTIALAATFHTSAVILLPLAALSEARNKLWTYFWVGIASLGMYYLFLQEQTTTLWENYVIAEYSQASEGGPIRVAMNALPAAMFLLLRKRIKMTYAQKRLWFWISVLSLLCMPLVLQAPTAVDRVALYFMPIQLVVLTHLIYLVHPHNRGFLRMGIVGLYALVQFVWLNYAAHAFAWLPYRFWPLEVGTY